MSIYKEGKKKSQPFWVLEELTGPLAQQIAIFKAFQLPIENWHTR